MLNIETHAQFVKYDNSYYYGDMEEFSSRKSWQFNFIKLGHRTTEIKAI